jgi:uncharacterized protein YjbI with pentapeptide repeats
MDTKLARSRWESASEAKHRKALIAALRRGRTSERHLLEHTGRTEDGLIDLRGLSFGLGIELARVQFRDMDLSHSDIGRGIFRRCTFEGVLFQEIESQWWNERGCQFTDVDFRRARLRDAAIGINGSIYTRVSFRGTDFSGTSFYRPQFTDCDFSDAKLKQIDFMVSSFVDCKFRGKLESVWFRRTWPLPRHEREFGKAPPNEMRNVDFAEVELWDAVFTGGLDLSQVILPQDGHHVLFRHLDVVLPTARGIVGTLPWSDEAKKVALLDIEALLVHVESQPMWILNVNEMIDILGEGAGEEFMELLKRLDEEVD